MNSQELEDLIRKIVIETLEEFSDRLHIVVLVDKANTNLLSLLTEGQWAPSGIKDYWQRKDLPNFDYQKLHVHIARQKHINTKTKQVSWNEDGTRHDRKSFNSNFNGMETAKQIARRALDLPDNFKLESFSERNKGQLIMESIENIPESCNIFIFEIRDNNQRTLLKG